MLFFENDIFDIETYKKYNEILKQKLNIQVHEFDHSLINYARTDCELIISDKEKHIFIQETLSKSEF